jgi:hypothetical protein
MNSHILTQLKALERVNKFGLCPRCYTADIVILEKRFTEQSNDLEKCYEKVSSVTRTYFVYERLYYGEKLLDIDYCLFCICCRNGWIP